MGNEIRISLLKQIGSADNLESPPSGLSGSHDHACLRLDFQSEFHGSLRPLILADREGRIRDVNEAALMLLNYELEALKRLNVSDVVIRLSEGAMGLVFTLLPFGRPIVLDALCARRNGSWFSSEVTAVFVADPQGGSECLVSLWLNEVKRPVDHDTGAMGGELGSSRAECIEMASLVAGQIAHDFNNLLTPMLAYPELIRHEIPSGTPVTDYLNIIEKTAEDMQRLTQQLLTLARRGRSGSEIFCPNESVNQAVVLMEASLPSGIRIDLELSDKLLNIQGGRESMRRVIENLVQNAVEAMGNSGVVKVSTANVYLDASSGISSTLNVGEYVKITVADTGTGIDPDVRERIFDPFFTTKKAVKKRGAGLGLSIVHGIIRDHRGYIDVETEVGKGSAFNVYIPISRSDVANGLDSSLPRGNERILVVDDDSPQLEVLTSLLKLLGYQATGVTSGEQCLALIRGQGQRYDLIILDMVMEQGLDGLETFREVRRTVPDQRVILISGFARTTPRVARAQELGAGVYLRKPLEVESLANSVREALDITPGKTESLPSNPRPRILIVDDDAMIRKLFGMIILGEFPEAVIEQTSNGDEAVEAFSLQRYDLVVMDLQMPIRDGREAFNEIDVMCRKNGWALPRVVFCTGYTPPESLHAIIRSNPIHCLIRKPVKAENLLECVRKLMRG